ncbi:hypothetical protein E2C01_038411 [Portunus trituberculatus]|uniref:Uncharacterized protein n=1 Tax=Portunus trituberculatus TaxID=210409 RepID=A0A5B7FE39_PORTR|nr:hypothetical protein [Portunus trituberculatus]
MTREANQQLPSITSRHMLLLQSPSCSLLRRLSLRQGARGKAGHQGVWMTAHLQYTHYRKTPPLRLTVNNYY